MSSTKMDRVPKGLSDYLDQKSREANVPKTDLYRQIELALKGIDSIGDILKAQAKKDEKKPPFAF
jgi:hypothetical protein